MVAVVSIVVARLLLGSCCGISGGYYAVAGGLIWYFRWLLGCCSVVAVVSIVVARLLLGSCGGISGGYYALAAGSVC